MKPIVYPADWLARNEPPPLSDFGRRLLAEGDSWFTIGSLNLPAASNLLFKLEFQTSTAIINCAYPGATLQHMVDLVNDAWFDGLLRKPRFQRFWEALVISAGGNDLIDAAQVPLLQPDGTPTPTGQRLLLTPGEADAAHPGDTSAGRYLSDEGWQLFAGYMQANFRELVKRRDDGISRGRPIFLHTYSVPVVRPAGTLGASQGWLYPALAAAQIPPGERQAVADMLFERLRQLLLGLDMTAPQGLPQVHVFDSASLVALDPSDPSSTGISGDWVNEIHPSPSGYGKLGMAFGAYIEQVLATYP